MKIVATVLALAFVCTPALGQQTKKTPKDKVRAIKTVTGTTVGFQTGDYQHVQIRKSNGKRQSFFLGKPGLDYFLALNKARSVVFRYQIVDSYIPESGGVMRIERLVSARVGSQAFEQWWRELKQKYSIDEIDKRYGPLVEKYQLQ